jgi:ABC-type multidrug transport system fused ATPase/permease subunit
VQELQDSNAKYLNLQHQLQLLQSKLEAVQQASADTAAVVSPIKAVTPYVYTSWFSNALFWLICGLIAIVFLSSISNWLGSYYITSWYGKPFLFLSDFFKRYIFSRHEKTQFLFSDANGNQYKVIKKFLDDGSEIIESIGIKMRNETYWVDIRQVVDALEKANLQLMENAIRSATVVPESSELASTIAEVASDANWMSALPF